MWSSIDSKKRGSHARGVYPSQRTSRLEAARVKQEEESDTRFVSTNNN